MGMIKSKQKKKRTLPALTLRITVVILILWLASMYAITSVTAESLFVNFWDMGESFMETVWAMSNYHNQLDGKTKTTTPPGYVDYVLWQASRYWIVGNNYGRLYSANHQQLLYSDGITVDTAIAVFDGDRNIVVYPSNFFAFEYFYNEDNVNKGLDQNPDGYAVCVLDRQMHPDSARFWLEQTALSSIRYDALYYRITGVLEDGYFTARELACFLKPEYGGEVTGWLTLIDPWNEIPEDAETVTLYTGSIYAQEYEESRSFMYNGQRVGSLSEFMSDVGPNVETWQNIQYDFTDYVYTRTMYYFGGVSWDDTADNSPELEYRLTVAMLASPWRSAISALRYVYIVTFLIVIIGLLILRSILKRNVAVPLAAVNNGIMEGWTHIYNPDDIPSKFAEPAELIDHYKETQARLSQNKDAITRLERTVEYAREAEENRRQLTSNIAHELKTPLAVIHSYAEGLSERIAEDKRDTYLGVIMSETGRMNDMVMEMLDLSRLEAGKVKLEREDFSLAEMAVSVFGRLERAIEAKNLNLTIDHAEDGMVNADPSRIEQVITNFAVNAVKYTPVGGYIRVRTTKMRNNITFSVENDSSALSRESLSKVWESFYSADESRSGSGTGLGLAIAKSVIELHGGICSARNTNTGVEFSFTL